MTMLKLVRLPECNIQDIPRGLRAIADEIEDGKYGDAHNLAWVIDCGDDRFEIGMLGAAPEPGITAYYLYGLAMRKLEVA